MILSASLLLLGALLAADQATKEEPPKPVPAPFLVQFHADAVQQRCGVDADLKQAVPALISALDLPPDTAISETPMSKMLREGTEKKPDFSRWMLLEVHVIPPIKRDTVEALTAKLRANPLVAHAEPDYDACRIREERVKAAPPADANTDTGLIPNDPLFRYQYYHAQLHTPEAWRITTGTAEVLVAVLDTGCNGALEDFSGRVLPGYDFTKAGPCTGDEKGHGTAIASLIGATGNNKKGIAGMDWQCRILPINAASSGVAAWVQAVEFATHAGARVLNISARLDVPEPSDLLEEALAAAEASGVTIVVSAGNQGAPHVAWPASSKHVLSVGAVDAFDRRWSDPVERDASNYGPGLDLVAPGADIVALGKDGQRVTGGGTSSAAALVSGACALMCAVNPDLTPKQIRNILRKTATKFAPASQWCDGFCEEFGYGRLNVYAAVKEAQRL